MGKHIYYIPCLIKSELLIDLTMGESEVDSDKLRGKPKSGRFWKTTQKQRFSAMKQDKGGKKTWDKKVAERLEKKLTKELESNLKEQKKKKMELLKKRERKEGEEKRKRKEGRSSPGHQRHFKNQEDEKEAVEIHSKTLKAPTLPSPSFLFHLSAINHSLLSFVKKK